MFPRPALSYLLLLCLLQAASTSAAAVSAISPDVQLSFGTRLLPDLLEHNRTFRYTFQTPKTTQRNSGDNLPESAASTTTIALVPRFANATYLPGADANHTGRLELLRDPTSDDHFYRWITSKNTVQEYRIKVPVPIPAGVQLRCDEPSTVRYRTALPQTLHNSIALSIMDVDGVSLAITPMEGLAATEWTSAILTPTDACNHPIVGNVLTVLVRLAAENQGGADIGAVTLNLFEPPAPRSGYPSCQPSQDLSNAMSSLL